MDDDPAIERRVAAINAHHILHRTDDAREPPRERKERDRPDREPPGLPPGR